MYNTTLNELTIGKINLSHLIENLKEDLDNGVCHQKLLSHLQLLIEPLEQQT